MDNQTVAMLSTEQRKKLLIAQGALHRFALLDAKTSVKQAVQVKALARGAAAAAALAGVTLFKRRASASTAGGLPAMLPLVISGISLLAKQTRQRPALRKSLLAGVAALAGAYLLKKVRQRRATPQQ